MRTAITSLRNKAKALIKDTKHLLTRSSLPSTFIHKDVPYFCQWESRELAKDILEHTIEAKDDPRWQNSGAKSKEEYASWSWSGCGMACTKMILAHNKNKVVPLVDLGKTCLKYGGYKEPLEKHAGLYYQPYTKFLKEEYNLNAKVVSGLSVSDIIKALSKGSYIIASVTPEIRYPENKPKHRSGHLILIVGFNSDKKKLFLHNPSGTNKSNQEYAEISFKDFNKFFSHRGIIINP